MWDIFDRLDITYLHKGCGGNLKLKFADYYQCEKCGSIVGIDQVKIVKIPIV